MKVLVLLPFIFSCSAVASDIEGCDTTYSVADCGHATPVRVSCSLPLGSPWNANGCRSPSGDDLSTVWCCESVK